MQIINQVKQVLAPVAVVAAGIVILKVFGVRVGIQGSVTEWTCVAIACALASK